MLPCYWVFSLSGQDRCSSACTWICRCRGKVFKGNHVVAGWDQCGGDKAQERERVHPCNVCDKAFKSLQMPSQHKIWQHSGHVFAGKGCGKKFNPNNSIKRHNKLVCGKPHCRKIFRHFFIWGKDDNWGDHPQSERVGGEEERKRIVLCSSRKRADILYPLKWKSIVLVFNKKTFLCNLRCNSGFLKQIYHKCSY